MFRRITQARIRRERGIIYVALKIDDAENEVEEDQEHVKISITMASARFCQRRRSWARRFTDDAF